MSYVAQNFPAPLQVATETQEMPPVVAKHLGMARAAGWDARVTVARGFTPDASGEPKRERVKFEFEEDSENPNGKKFEWRETGELVVIESYALRAHKDGETLVAVWHFERDRVKKRASDSKKGEWRKGDEYLADVCSLDLAMLRSGERFKNVTELGAFLA